MALNPIAYTEKVVRSFLRYQLTAYPFADPRLHAQMRALLSLDRTRRSPLLQGPYVSLSRPFRQGAPIDALIAENLLHPHLRERVPKGIAHLYGHQERAIRAIAAGRTTLVSTGTGSGKTECFLYPIVSRCLHLRDEAAPPGISAVIVYPMNALAEDQLMRLRALLAGTGIPFGIYVGKTPEGEAEVAGVRLSAGSSRADYEARLERVRRAGSGETVYPPEEVCSREAMRTPGRQPRILLTNVKQLELLLTRQQDVELFADARLDFLVFDEAHTFTGALGAETACLIRRLRAFCNPGGNADAGRDRRPGRPAVLPRETADARDRRADEGGRGLLHAGRTTCVATSATIVDRGDPGAARNFAARFFGVAPEAVATVGEDYEAEVWAEPRSVPPAPGEDPAGILDRCVHAVEDEDGSGAGVRAAYRSLAGEALPVGEELVEGARPWHGAGDERSRPGAEGERSRLGVKGRSPRPEAEGERLDLGVEGRRLRSDAGGGRPQLEPEGERLRLGAEDDGRLRPDAEGGRSRPGVKGARPESGIGDAEEGSRPRFGVEGAGGWPEALHAALSRNELVFRLNEELETPRALDELPPALERHVGRPVTEAEILAWLTLGAAARCEGRPLLRPVVHGFVRGIGGAVVSFPEDAGGPRLWLAAEDEAGPAEPLDGKREGESSTNAATPSMSGPAGGARLTGGPREEQGSGRREGTQPPMQFDARSQPGNHLPGERSGSRQLPGLPGGRSTIVPASAGEREGESSTNAAASSVPGPTAEREGEPSATEESDERQAPDGTRERSQAPGESHARFPVTTCTTCGQHYYVAFLKDFTFTGKQPGGGEAGSGNSGGSWWEPLDETFGGRRVVLVDRLIGASDDEDHDEAGSVASGRAVSGAIDRDETGFDESDDAALPPPAHTAPPPGTACPVGTRASRPHDRLPSGHGAPLESDAASGAVHPPSPTHATPPPRRAADTARDAPPHPRTAPLWLCRRCGAAHPRPVSRCLHCGHAGAPVQLHAVRQREANPGRLTSCLSCGATGHRLGGRYREPARPVRAINVADVHVLAQDMVHHAGRRRLLVFCDNRQDAAFQAGWMKDHARRFRLRALMAEGIRTSPRSVGDLAAWLDDLLDADEALSRALIPEVWQVARRESGGGREGGGGRHAQERRKYLRFQVLREVTLSSRQALGLEPWGRMKVEYQSLDASLPWIQEHAHALGLPAERLCEGVASVLDYLRRKRALHDPEHEIFGKHWMEGDREIQQGYLPGFLAPNATKLRRGATEKPALVTQWLSGGGSGRGGGGGDTTIRRIARKWSVPAPDVEPFLEGLFDFLVERGLLAAVRLKGSRGRPLPNVSGVYQVNADKLRLNPNRGVRRCRRCRRTTTRDLPHGRCPAWRCDGGLEWVREDGDNYDLHLLDGAYSMLRPEEHTAMVPNEERERLENLFKGASDAVNCLVCTPTLELGVDIGQLDSVLMRNVPPLPANYWQRAGRAGRRHRMAVDLTYCRPVSHDRAYFADPPKLLAGRIDPPAFNLRNEVMIAKHVHATVIAGLHRLCRDGSRHPVPAGSRRRSETERNEIRDVLDRCLPRRVEPYLFEDGEVRTVPFDFDPLRDLVRRHADALAADMRRVFEQGWPEADAGVTAPAVLRAHVEGFADRLEAVVARLRRRLRWAMDQIRRLNATRERQGTLDPGDEALFRRCDALVKRLKGAGRRRRRQAEGHDDFNTFSVLAAEGFLPGYGLEVGSVVGWAEIPFWRTGAMDFSLPRPPAVALREYVPGNLIYANGHRFVARRFHRDLGEDRAEMPVYAVSAERQAVRPAGHGEGAAPLGGQVLQAMSVCDADLIHTSHISDEEDLRFQLGVAVYGMELGPHGGGRAYRWGPRPVLLRRGVRLRLVNVGAAAAIGERGEFGYPVCTVCGQSVSPLSSERQRETFRASHADRCRRPPEPIGFYADVVADALSLPACDDPTTAYSVLEALRFGAARVLDMHMDDLQILVIGHVERTPVDGLLWDPMPGGSGLLERLCERFGEVVAVAREVVEGCPAVCASSCIDCLRTFRNAYYHPFLVRATARERLDEWGRRLAFEHDVPPRQPAAAPAPGGHAAPVNDAETKLRHLLLAAGFADGIRGEQIRLDRALGTTTPDVVYRGEDYEPDEGVCLYLDGLSRHLHGNPETAERDRDIRAWLRNHGYEVVEIAASELDDEDAMVRHFRRLAGYLGMRELRSRVRDDRSWFRGREGAGGGRAWSGREEERGRTARGSGEAAGGSGAARSGREEEPGRGAHSVGEEVSGGRMRSGSEEASGERTRNGQEGERGRTATPRRGGDEMRGPPPRARLRLVRPAADARYVRCVPLVPLAAAAGTFGDPHTVPGESEWEWVEVDTARPLRRGMFVARVVGRSMEPAVPGGAWCLFASPVTGTRAGKVVLVQLHDALDPDTGQRFTVKRYRSEKTAGEDGWRHVRITLAPDNPEFSPIELKEEDEGSVAVVAELVEVIGPEPPAEGQADS